MRIDIQHVMKRGALPLLFAGIASVGLMLNSCTDRGNPIFDPDTPSGINIWRVQHVYLETQLSQFDDLPVTYARVYTPPNYGGVGLGRPYPTLYLLSPFRGDENFYFHHGLHTVLDRMIAEKKIEPMIVVTLNGSANAFGGSFYGRYMTNGRFQQMATRAVPAFVDTQFNTLQGPAYRAISGYEMGGYGAVRAFLEDADPASGAPGHQIGFDAVSAIAAPLYFTHPTAGFQPMFTQAIAEWGSFEDIDSSSMTPASGFLLAAAIGFTPEDTVYDPDPTFNLYNNSFQVNKIWKIYDSLVDTNAFWNPVRDSFFTIDTTVFPYDTMLDSTNCGLPNCDTTGIGDTITNDTVFVYNPPTDITFPTFPDSRTLEDDILRIYLPFDTNGNPYPKIWDIWTPNDAFNLVRTVPQAVRDALSGHVLVMSSTQAKFNHYTQDSLFVDDLKSQGVQAEFRSYDGYDGFADVLGERYLYDILPTILKFHSDRFHDNLPADLKIPDSVYQTGY